MSTNELLEVGKILGSIVGVWFALVGWKLVSRSGAFGPRSTGTNTIRSPRLRGT